MQVRLLSEICLLKLGMEGVMLRAGLALLLCAMLSGCVGSGDSNSTTSVASSVNVTTPSGSAPLITYSIYTSSQFGSRLPSFKVTGTNSNIGFYQYGVGSATYSTLIPIGQTFAIDPALLTDGATTKIFIRGVHTDKVTNESPVALAVRTDLSPWVADGYYVGDRSMISYGPGKLNDVRRIAYNGTRSFNNIPDAKLKLYDADDLASLSFVASSRDLAVTTMSVISASLTSGSPSTVEISFGQDFDSIRAVGGSTTATAGSSTTGAAGYFDRMILNYSGVDPVLGQIPIAAGSTIPSDLRLYKVRKDIDSTVGLLNAAGTLQNVVANPSDNTVVKTLYGVYLTVQTFDNAKFAGHLRLLDYTKKTVYSYKAIGRAGSLDGTPNGILFNAADNISVGGGFHGFLTYDANLKINQMTIYSDNIRTEVSIYSTGVTASPALSSYQTTSNALSIQMMQPFNPWP
jgi:hypothetical protein